ncbi:hypothetical protein BVRB_030390 [Beta vulgaris subsp. vulgaris]|uniref:Uncharacterized protein n=1 Tax=Beta vulgaris subsp. vulgaris TaxID=3555 RepID=A0A0J8AXT8_BETVV|nr:hypothetical protein BVRB_030390 [Beta vulgaris subsp. vulgaris]
MRHCNVSMQAVGIVISAQRTTRGKFFKAFLLCPQGWTPTGQMQKSRTAFSSSLFWGTSRTGIPYLIAGIRPSNIHMICAETIRVDEHEILIEQRAVDIQRVLDQLQTIDINTVQELHPSRDMKIRDIDLVSKVINLENLSPLDASK